MISLREGCSNQEGGGGGEREMRRRRRRRAGEQNGEQEPDQNREGAGEQRSKLESRRRANVGEGGWRKCKRRTMVGVLPHILGYRCSLCSSALRPTAQVVSPRKTWHQNEVEGQSSVPRERIQPQSASLDPGINFARSLKTPWVPMQAEVTKSPG